MVNVKNCIEQNESYNYSAKNQVISKTFFDVN